MITAGKANYGIDAPGVVRNLGIVAVLAAVLAFLPLPAGNVVQGVQSSAFWVFVACGLTCAIMLCGSLFVKQRLRDKILTALQLRGSERLLDVGCGSGLLLLGAAKRLDSGRAVGIDRWQTVDQSGNSAERTRANARAEGVEDRIEIVTGDMRQLPFPDATFDVVVSSWAIHNLSQRADRASAIDEIVRVLAPGGRLVIVDIERSAEYVARLGELGIPATRSGPNFLFVTPTRTVRAEKPATAV